MSVYTCSTNDSSVNEMKVVHGSNSVAALNTEAKGAEVLFDSWLISLSIYNAMFSAQNKVYVFTFQSTFE